MTQSSSIVAQIYGDAAEAYFSGESTGIDTLETERENTPDNNEDSYVDATEDLQPQTSTPAQKLDSCSRTRPSK